MKKIRVSNDVYVRFQTPNKLAVVFMFLCVFISLSVVICMKVSIADYKYKTNNLLNEVAAEQKEIEKYKIDNVQSVDFIKRVAEQEFGYVYKDVTIFDVLYVNGVDEYNNYLSKNKNNSVYHADNIDSIEDVYTNVSGGE